MKLFSSFLIVLAFFPYIHAQQKPVNVCRYETKYNHEADVTTVFCDELLKWGEAPAGLTIRANVSFRGKESNETAVFWLTLSSNKGGATRTTRPLFQEAKSLQLSTGSESFDIPLRDYDKTYFELIRSSAESAHAEIGREELRKLLEARSLQGRWGTVEFKLSDPALISLKKFVSREVFHVKPTE
jgi:hypothetical protein